mmetsp:Transcript_89895/g.240219  ORF Transcript_89895/g.240219 Transcript_89895/m.240219 type:complete len:84 (+) Transcript_89895:249-500(+)
MLKNMLANRGVQPVHVWEPFERLERGMKDSGRPEEAQEQDGESPGVHPGYLEEMCIAEEGQVLKNNGKRLNFHEERRANCIWR